MNFASDHALRLNLHAALREDDAIETAGNHNAISFDLPFDFRAVSEHHGLLRDNVAPHVSVNPERAFDRQRSFKRNALIDEASPLFASSAILCGGAPLPSHLKIPPNLWRRNLRRLLL